jgi:hypothetical protein
MTASFTVFSWIGMLLSLTGAFYVARGTRYFGFALFLLADAFLLPIQIETRTWSQVVLLIAYAAINLYAILLRWTQAHRGF